MESFNNLRKFKGKVKGGIVNFLLDWQNFCHRVTDVMDTTIEIKAGCWLFLYFGLILTSLLLFLSTGNPIIFITSFFLTSYFIGMRWM